MKILKGRTRQSGQWIPQSIHLRFHGAKGSSRWELRRLEAGTQPFGPRGERVIRRNWCREVNLKQSACGRERLRRLLHSWLHSSPETSHGRPPASGARRPVLSAARPRKLRRRRPAGCRRTAAPHGWLRAGHREFGRVRQLAGRSINHKQRRLVVLILYKIEISSTPPGPLRSARTPAQIRTRGRQAAVSPALRPCRTLVPSTRTGARSLYSASGRTSYRPHKHPSRCRTTTEPSEWRHH